MENDKNILLVDCIFILLWIKSKAKHFFWKQLSMILTYLETQKFLIWQAIHFIKKENNECWRDTNIKVKHQNIRTLFWHLDTKHVNKACSCWRSIQIHESVRGILIQVMTFQSLAPITCCHTIMQNVLSPDSQVLFVFQSQHSLKALSLFWGSGNILTISPCKIKMQIICSQHTVVHNISKKWDIGS